MMKVGSAKWNRLLLEASQAMDMDMDREKIDQFAIHARELMKWNERVNLTAIRDPLEVAVKHFIDSVVPAAMVPPGAFLLDIGSGGGFPGIPLKIMIPSLKLTLIDTSRKKVNFLKYLSRRLRLADTRVFQVSASDLAKDKAFANRFGVITSRALSDLKRLVQMGLPLLSKEGVMIAWKGKVAGAELDAMRQFRLNDPPLSRAGKPRLSLAVQKYTLPYIRSERRIIRIQYLPI